MYLSHYILASSWGSVTLSTSSLINEPSADSTLAQFDASLSSSALLQVPNQSQPQLTDNPMPTEISEAIRRLDDR